MSTNFNPDNTIDKSLEFDAMAVMEQIHMA